MAEYTAALVQTVNAGQNILFTETPVRSCSGAITHREGSGLVTLKGATCQKCARFKVTFNGNIAVLTGETVGPISIGIALSGEALASTNAIFTPAAAGDFGNVSTFAFVTVPAGCCVTVAVQNTSTQAIQVQNANIIVERTC